LYLRFFKSAFFIQYFLIGIIGLVLWLPAFINPPQMPPPDGPVLLYALLYSILHGTPLLAALLGFILVCWETWFFAEIINKNELVLKNTTLSPLLFFVLISLFPNQLTLTPTTFALFFILLILHHLMIIYRKPEHFDRVFAVGFYTALASLFYLPVLLWMGLVIISFFLFRSGVWREWFAAIIGMLTPFIYLSFYYYWNDEFLARASEYPVFFQRPYLSENITNPGFWLPEGIVLILALWGTLKLWGGPLEKTVELRAKLNLFIWTLVFTLLSSIYSHTLTEYHTMLAIPALAMIIAAALTSLKKTRMIEMILLILFLALLVNNLLLYPMEIR